LNAPDEAQPNARADDDGIRLEDIDVPAEGSRWAKREGALWGTLYGALGGALAGLALGSAVPVSVETSETNDGKRSPSESDSG